MASKNVFDLHFEQVTESHQQLETIRNKLIEGMVELCEVKRVYSSKQKELVEKEVGLTKLVGANQELKISLMKALIEKEELVSKKTALFNSINDLNLQIGNLDRDSYLKLLDERVSNFCERNSTENQRDILNKIVDAKCKLMEYGPYRSE